MPGNEKGAPIKTRGNCSGKVWATSGTRVITLGDLRVEENERAGDAAVDALCEVRV